MNRTTTTDNLGILQAGAVGNESLAVILYNTTSDDVLTRLTVGQALRVADTLDNPDPDPRYIDTIPTGTCHTSIIIRNRKDGRTTLSVATVHGRTSDVGQIHLTGEAARFTAGWLRSETKVCDQRVAARIALGRAASRLDGVAFPSAA